LQLISNLISRVKTWMREEAGQTLVEYALIIALVSIVLVLALEALAGGIGNVFSNIVVELGGSGGGGS
jgi:pilus assembly protein Flp/PilA